MHNTFLFILGSTLLFFFFSSVYFWMRAGVRRLEGKPILELAPRYRTPWDYAEILMSIGMLILGIIITQRTMLALGWISPTVPNVERSVDEKATLMLGIAFVELIVMGLVYFWISRRIVSPPGPDPYPGLASKIRIGIAAGFMLIPPALLVQILVSLFQPYKHDLLEMVTETPSVKFFLIAGFTAVIVAPIAEEVFFRMLLQGWLESIQRKPSSPLMIQSEQPDRTADPYGLDFTKRLQAVNVETIREDGSGQLVIQVPSAAEQVSTEDALITPPFWPILVSAMLFALMHWGQGLAPISLFFLSLGLGFLYRQTHSVIPSVVVHFMLNGFSMLMVLGATIAQPADATKKKPVPVAPVPVPVESTNANHTGYRHIEPIHRDAIHRVGQDV